MREVCTNVEVEPKAAASEQGVLIHSSVNPDQEAQLDVMARGSRGGTFECACFDDQVFNPCARSNEARCQGKEQFIFLLPELN